MSTWLHDLLVVGGPTVLVGLTLGGWLVRKWLEQILQIRIEKFRSEQQKEIESLRHRLSSRISRIHEKEFDVLPRAWFMLNELHGWIMVVFGVTFKRYPDFGQLADAQFEEFLNVNPASRLSAYQKDALRKLEDPRDRQKSFSKAMAACDMDEAKEKLRLFQNFLIKNRIFMNDELREKLGAVNDPLSRALSNFEIASEGSGDSQMEHSALEELSLLKDKVAAVEQAIQRRLRYDEA